MEIQYLPMFDQSRYPMNACTIPLMMQRIKCDIEWCAIINSSNPDVELLQELYTFARNIDTNLEVLSHQILNQ